MEISLSYFQQRNLRSERKDTPTVLKPMAYLITLPDGIVNEIKKIFAMLARDIESGENKYVSIDALKKLYTEVTGHVSSVHKYHVIRWDEPSNLIPAHLYKDGLRHIHPDPEQARSITVREAARLQGFPDSYVFTGTQADAYKMIGNAVPPIFSKILATAIYQLLFENGGDECAVLQKS